MMEHGTLRKMRVAERRGWRDADGSVLLPPRPLPRSLSFCPPPYPSPSPTQPSFALSYTPNPIHLGSAPLRSAPFSRGGGGCWKCPAILLIVGAGPATDSCITPKSRAKLAIFTSHRESARLVYLFIHA
jgi:hypothetical protein